MNYEIDVPDDYVGDVVGDLNGRRGRMQGMDQIAPGKTRVKAIVPMATTMRYVLELRSMTKGRGRFKASFAHYEEVPTNETHALVTMFEKDKASHEADH
jgi:elongation factor G